MEATKTTTQQAIADSIAALAAQLQQGNSAAFASYLQAMGRFYCYSFGNQLLIAMQRPDAARVAGFHAWRQLGRFVKKGEKGIRILAPIVRRADVVDAANSTDANSSRIAGFRSVYVFDVAQTDGAELPGLGGVSGDPGDSYARLEAFATSQGIALELHGDLGSAEGLSCGGTIKLLATLPPAQLVAVLAHELAHELLHKGERRTNTNAGTRELEAEAVSFVVCRAIGLDVNTHSADYIRLYDGDADKLADSLGAISRTSATLLAALQGGAQ